MKESKQITLGSSDSITIAADFKYSMRVALPIVSA
jgi:hypothetical protein